MNELVSQIRQQGDAVLAVVNGEIDLNNSPELRTVLLGLLNRHGPRRLVLNLSGVPYMDSSALAVLVELLRRIGKGGKLYLTNLQPRVKGLLEIARLNTIFAITATEEEALK